MGMRRNIVIALLVALIAVGFGHRLIKAADVEIILGTSSAFNVVRGTDVSSGTKMLYVGSSTVSIGTTTQNAMLYVAGSSTSGSDASLRVRNSSGTDTLSVRNDGAILIGTNTSTLNSALYVGSATSGSLGTMTAGFLSIGTVSANTSLHGTTTVRFLSDIYANGTITAGVKFVGDGSLLTGITASGGVTGGNISTSGTISAGSTTVSTLTSTGSTTVTGTLTAGGGNLVVDNSTSRAVIDFNTVGIGTNTPSSSYMLQVTDSSDLGVVVGSSGSLTAKTITATGSATVTGTLTAGGGNFVVDNSISRAVIDFNTVGIGTNTPSSSYRLQVTDDADLGVVVGTSGSITAKTLTSTGSITITNNGTMTAGFLSIGTVSASSSTHGTTTVRFLDSIVVNGTITAGVKFVGDGSLLSGITASAGVTGGNISTSGTISAGSTTVSTLTTTGSATVSNTLTAASSTFRADSGSVTVTTRVGIGTSTPSSSYRLQVTDNADLGFVVGSSGSITAKTLAVTGSATVSGNVIAATTSGSSVGIGTTTPSSSYRLQVTTDADLGFVVGSSGSITAKTITSTGSATVAGTLTVATASGSRVGIGTTTPQSEFHVVGATGSPKSGTITAGFLSVGTITANVGLHGTTTVHFPGGIFVTGNKSFLIPHPDPEKKGWLLQHCSVESPTRGDNLYRYKVTISSDGGETSIDLPSYWPHLNENPDVWVSSVGQFARGYGYVDEGVNKLIIKGEKRGTYNVLLIGTRKDSFAKEFDAKGVEYIDYEVSELLTHGGRKEAKDIQLINTKDDNGNKTFLDPIDDAFGLAICQ